MNKLENDLRNREQGDVGRGTGLEREPRKTARKREPLLEAGGFENKGGFSIHPRALAAALSYIHVCHGCLTPDTPNTHHSNVNSWAEAINSPANSQSPILTQYMTQYENDTLKIHKTQSIFKIKTVYLHTEPCSNGMMCHIFIFLKIILVSTMNHHQRCSENREGVDNCGWPTKIFTETSSGIEWVQVCIKQHNLDDLTNVPGSLSRELYNKGQTFPALHHFICMYVLQS